jgi:hypothetical protein
VHTKVTFGGAATGPYATFDNAAGVHNGALSVHSATGTNGAFPAAQDPQEIGSPGARVQLGITRGGLVYNRATRRFAQSLTVRNTGPVAVAGPIHLALDSLSGNATLVNPTGTTSTRPPLGSPYITMVPQGGLLGAGATLTVTLQFDNPSMAPISYSHRVLLTAP